jgi:hypothetical protein
MFYLGFGFILLAIGGFVLSLAAGMPGLGPVTNIALLAGIALLAAGLVTQGRRRDQLSRHA